MYSILYFYSPIIAPTAYSVPLKRVKLIVLGTLRLKKVAANVTLDTTSSTGFKNAVSPIESLKHELVLSVVRALTSDSPKQYDLSAQNTLSSTER